MHPTASRRVALTGLAAAAPATLALAEVPARPDPHLAWEAEWREKLAYCNGPAAKGLDDLNELPEWRRVVELEGLIATTPAVSPAGVRAQLRFAVESVDEFGCLGEFGADALGLALATLDRLAGEA